MSLVPTAKQLGKQAFKPAVGATQKAIKFGAKTFRFGRMKVNTFNKTPLGKALKDSKVDRDKISSINQLSAAARARAERDKENQKAKETVNLLGIGTEDFFSPPKRKTPPRPINPRKFFNKKLAEFLNPKSPSGNETQSPKAKAGYFGTPNYNGMGFKGVGTAGYSSTAAANPNNSAHADFGDISAAMGPEAGGMVGTDVDWGWPVVLDLNNDGIQIIPLSHSTARFDIAGTGSRQVLAWPGRRKGCLFMTGTGIG